MRFSRKFRPGWEAMFERQRAAFLAFVPPEGWARANAPVILQTTGGPWEVFPAIVDARFAIHMYAASDSKRSGLLLRASHRATGTRVLRGCDAADLILWLQRNKDAYPWDKVTDWSRRKIDVDKALRDTMRARVDSFEAAQFERAGADGSA